MVASSQAGSVAAAYPGVASPRRRTTPLQDDDVALVVVATPNDTHAPLAEAACVPASTWSWTSRSPSRSTRHAALAATAGTTGRLLSVFQNRRWDSDFLGIRDAIQAGTIGDVVEYRSEMARWRPQVRDRWRERPGPGAGLWYDLGPHLIDQAVELFGVPDAVQATLRTLRPGGHTDDWFHVRARLPHAAGDPRVDHAGGGSAAAFRRARHERQPGQAGRRSAGAAAARGRPPGHRGWGEDPDPLLVFRDGAEAQRRSVPAGDYGAFYIAMRDAVRQGRTPPVSVTAALTVMAILTAGLQSSSTGPRRAPG